MNTESDSAATPAPVRTSLAGMIVGIFAIVIVTAVLTAAFSSSSADDKLNQVTHRLEVLAAAQEQAAKTDAARQAATLRARERNLDYQHEVMRQNRILRHQLVVLATTLRKNGIDVPKLPSGASSKPSADPKAPAPASPRNRGSRAPTAPSPRSPRATPSPDLNCLLMPEFCVGIR